MQFSKGKGALDIVLLHIAVVFLFIAIVRNIIMFLTSDVSSLNLGRENNYAI
jgi:hypothetical protein